MDMYQSVLKENRSKSYYYDIAARALAEIDEFLHLSMAVPAKEFVKDVADFTKPYKTYFQLMRDVLGRMVYYATGIYHVLYGVALLFASPVIAYGIVSFTEVPKKHAVLAALAAPFIHILVGLAQMSIATMMLPRVIIRLVATCLVNPSKIEDSKGIHELVTEYDSKQGDTARQEIIGKVLVEKTEKALLRAQKTDIHDLLIFDALREAERGSFGRLVSVFRNEMQSKGVKVTPRYNTEDVLNRPDVVYSLRVKSLSRYVSTAVSSNQPSLETERKVMNVIRFFNDYSPGKQTRNLNHRLQKFMSA